MSEQTIAIKQVLLVSGVSGAEQCAAAILRQLAVEVKAVPGRREAVEALRTATYAAVIVEESLAEGDPRWAELLWKMAGLAIPMQVNFALTGSTRLVRDLRAAFTRREQEQSAAQRAAMNAMESELRSTVSGLVLHTQLALQEQLDCPQLQARLRLMAELAGSLKQRLDVAQA